MAAAATTPAKEDGDAKATSGSCDKSGSSSASDKGKPRLLTFNNLDIQKPAYPSTLIASVKPGGRRWDESGVTQPGATQPGTTHWAEATIHFGEDDVKKLKALGVSDVCYWSGATAKTPWIEVDKHTGEPEPGALLFVQYQGRSTSGSGWSQTMFYRSAKDPK
jgi:hypothetical protein